MSTITSERESGTVVQPASNQPADSPSSRKPWVFLTKNYAVAIVLAALAVVLLVVGLVIRNQSEFAVNTVDSQLGAQGITFTPVSGLTAAQKTHQCLIANAGKQLTTGAQAECYANYQIALDLLSVDRGKTYAQASYPARLLEVKLGELSAKDPTSPQIPVLAAEAAKAEAPADTLFQGESLRGMLLTTYGFSHMGDLGNETADVLFLLAGLSLVGAIVAAAVTATRKREREPLVA